jgi:hypothetical protein
MYIFICAYLHTHNTHKHTHIETFENMCLHITFYAHINMHTHKYAHINMHTHKYADTTTQHTHIQTFENVCLHTTFYAHTSWLRCTEPASSKKKTQKKYFIDMRARP